MTIGKLKKIIIRCVMEELEQKEFCKRAKKHLDNAVKLETEFLKNLSEEKINEYNLLLSEYTLYGGLDTIYQIEMAIGFAVDLLLSIK